MILKAGYFPSRYRVLPLAPRSCIGCAHHRLARSAFVLWPSSPIRVCEESFGYEGFSGRRCCRDANARAPLFDGNVFESLLGIRTGAQNGVSQIAKCPYKIVRPKLNVSQNKSLILFTQGTPTPSRHGAFGNPIGSLGLARDQVSFTTPGVGVGNRRAFGALQLSHR